MCEGASSVCQGASSVCENFKFEYMLLMPFTIRTIFEIDTSYVTKEKSTPYQHSQCMYACRTGSLAAWKEHNPHPQKYSH